MRASLPASLIEEQASLSPNFITRNGLNLLGTTGLTAQLARQGMLHSNLDTARWKLL